MFTDASLQFSAAQAITSTAASTNYVDFTTPEDMGIGMKTLKFAIYVSTAFVSGGGATLQIQAETSADASTWYVVGETDAFLAAALTVNQKIRLLLEGINPKQMPTTGAAALFPRYLQLNYVVGTSTFSAGALNAYLVIDRQDNEVSQYKSGYTVGA